MVRGGWGLALWLAAGACGSSQGNPVADDDASAPVTPDAAAISDASVPGPQAWTIATVDGITGLEVQDGRNFGELLVFVRTGATYSRFHVFQGASEPDVSRQDSPCTFADLIPGNSSSLTGYYDFSCPEGGLHLASLDVSFPFGFGTGRAFTPDNFSYTEATSTEVLIHICDALQSPDPPCFVSRRLALGDVTRIELGGGIILSTANGFVHSWSGNQERTVWSLPGRDGQVVRSDFRGEVFYINDGRLEYPVCDQQLNCQSEPVDTGSEEPVLAFAMTPVFDEDVALVMRRPGSLVVGLVEEFTKRFLPALSLPASVDDNSHVAIVNVAAKIVSIVWTDGREIRLATVTPFP